MWRNAADRLHHTRIDYQLNKEGPQVIRSRIVWFCDIAFQS